MRFGEGVMRSTHRGYFRGCLGRVGGGAWRPGGLDPPVTNIKYLGRTFTVKRGYRIRG